MSRGASVIYSFSGNTKRAAVWLNQELRAGGNENKVIDLRPVNEPRSFLRQGIQALLKSPVTLADTLEYDLRWVEYAVFASPVWAFTIAPAMRVYLNRVRGLNGKKTACFVTYGSGTGKNRALGELEEILKGKGARVLFSRAFSGASCRKEPFLRKAFSPLCEILNP
ncbi:MAG: hypothetical protein GF333_01460 [Candidatus Omnitrophica bacterium]|nr:hypothetical protein [Candidatus Omnitrophota bacterium]